MNKGIGLLMLCLFSILSVLGQSKPLKYLPFEVKNTGIYNISNIRKVDTATFVDVHVTFIPNWWSKFSKTNFIKDSHSDKTYYAKNIIGAEFDKELWTPKSGDTLITLIFDPIDKGLRELDFGGEGKTQIFNISLVNPQQNIITDKSIPKDIQKWLTSELSMAKVKEPLSDYTDSFFWSDTVRIVGYLKGYDRRLGFSTGMIYNSNELTREDMPTTVQIYEDGRFETKISLNHPKISYIVLNNKWIEFYAEPGHTVGLVLDWEDYLQADRYRDRSYDFQYVEFQGALANINTAIRKVKIDVPDYNYLSHAQKEILPDVFKGDVLSRWQKEKVRIDSIVKNDKVSPKLAALLQSDVDVRYANLCFEYALARDYYSQIDTANAVLKVPLGDNYYDFIDLLDLNNKMFLVSTGFVVLINRFEYSPVYLPYRAFEDLDESVLNLDSLYGEMTLMHEIAKLRSLRLKMNAGSNEQNIIDLSENFSASVKNEFLRSEVSRLKELYGRRKIAYSLPTTKAADVFRKIINAHQGKILMVDFWAQGCGPCRMGIEKTLEDRQKYAEHPDFDFLFITDEKGTETKFYEKYTVENKMINTYRITEDEYLLLRELFQFNGIPRYVLVDADGKIRNDDFLMHNWKTELERYYPDRFAGDNKLL